MISIITFQCEILGGEEPRVSSADLINSRAECNSRHHPQPVCTFSLKFFFLILPYKSSLRPNENENENENEEKKRKKKTDIFSKNKAKPCQN